MRLRTFLAIELDPVVKEAVRKTVDGLKLEPNLFRWVSEEHMHLTIRFLGSVEETKINKINNVLSEAVKEIQPFQLSFQGIGGFPHLKKCRVLWIGVQKGAEECVHLKKSIDQSLVPLGFALEPEEYVPHLTIGRAKHDRFVSCQFESETVVVNTNEQCVSCLHLYKSDLHPNGPVHTKLFAFQFLAKQE